MKKAFEQTVSRSRPRVKLGSLLEEATSPGEDAPPAFPAVARAHSPPPAPAQEEAPTAVRIPEPSAPRAATTEISRSNGTLPA